MTTNQVLRDPSVKQEECWMVVYNARVCSPRWHARGPAMAYLALLEAGARRPEYPIQPTVRTLKVARPHRDRPLEFPVPPFVRSAAYVATEVKKIVDSTPPPEVSCTKVEPPITADEARSRQMTLTLKGLSKNGKNAFYAGAATVIRIALSAFPGKVAASYIEVAENTFAPAKPVRVKMTAEERKAARAAKPKPTEAERIAKMEANLAKRKAKLEAATASM